jgi:hypothetical protein
VIQVQLLRIPSLPGDAILLYFLYLASVAESTGFHPYHAVATEFQTASVPQPGVVQEPAPSAAAKVYGTLWDGLGG